MSAVPSCIQRQHPAPSGRSTHAAGLGAVAIALLAIAFPVVSLAAEGAAPAAAQVPPAAGRTVPLDFAYRIHGTGPAIGIVFDDGRDVFLQPLNPALLGALRIVDRPSRVQAPYLVVNGLAGRIEVAASGEGGGRTVVEYVGTDRRAAPDVRCPAPAHDPQRVTVPFGTGALQTEPGGVEQLARMVAIARGARQVTIVAYADRADSPIARRRSARLRELLVASGVDPAVIIEQVQRPAASAVRVVALPSALPCESVVAAGSAPAIPSQPGHLSVTALERPAVPATPAQPRPTTPTAVPAPPPIVSPSAIVPAVLAVHPSPAGQLPAGTGPAAGTARDETRPVPEAPVGADMRLSFLPNRSVQATLREYLKAHGMEVEFRSMPLLMVESFAEVEGTDLREVLRRALSRLGLRGELRGNRLLVVEQAR